MSYLKIANKINGAIKEAVTEDNVKVDEIYAALSTLVVIWGKRLADSIDNGRPE